MTYQQRSRHGNTNNNNNHHRTRRSKKKKHHNMNLSNKNSNQHKHSNSNKQHSRDSYLMTNDNHNHHHHHHHQHQHQHQHQQQHSDPSAPHYTPPPRHRKPDNRRYNKSNHTNKDNRWIPNLYDNKSWSDNARGNNNKKHHHYGDMMHLPEPNSMGNKRRQSYSEPTPEAEEIEDHNADFIASTESVSSHSMVTNGDAPHSDSNINYLSDKENANGLSHDGVYCHNNQRTKQNYYYQRKPVHNNINNSNSSKSSLASSVASLHLKDNLKCTKDDELARAAAAESSADCSGSEEKQTKDDQQSAQDLTVYRPLTPKGSTVIDSTQIESHLRKNYNHNNVNVVNHNLNNINCYGYNNNMNNINNQYQSNSLSPALNGSYTHNNNTNFNQNGYNGPLQPPHPLHYGPPQPLLLDPPYNTNNHNNNMCGFNGNNGNNMGYDNMGYTTTYHHSPIYPNQHQQHQPLQQQQPLYSDNASPASLSNDYPYDNHSQFMNHNQNNNNNIPSNEDYTGCQLTADKQFDGEFFVSIDVECAATGYGHFDSAPCRIAMVDFYGRILFDKIARVPNLMDPLSEFTGLTKWQIQSGDSLHDVLTEFHQILIRFNKLYKYGVTIIGQSLVMDIIWTKLHRGIHYQRTIDIAHEFKTQQAKWSKFTYYPLRQVAWALLDVQMNDLYHDPTEDARVTIHLYREFCLDKDTKHKAKEKLKIIKAQNKFPDFRVYTKFPQCSGMYSPKRCHCGQTTAADCNGVKDIDKLRKLYNGHQSKPVLFKYQKQQKQQKHKHQHQHQHRNHANHK